MYIDMNKQFNNMNTNMSMPKDTYPKIFDLPNEIIFLIINKLNINDVIYSLLDINERFAQLIFDPLYIRNLDTTTMTIKSFHHRLFSAHEQVLSRLCENILPKIHDQIHKLSIEQHSIERILKFNYSQLYSLSLINFKEEILFQYLTDNSVLRDLLSQQITHLTVDIQNKKISELCKISPEIFILVLSLCKHLICLNFCQMAYGNSFICVRELSRTSCMSSTLTELKINVDTLNDCLYLFDEIFERLSTLIINVKKIRFEPPKISNWKKLPGLKCFSLTSIDYTHRYDGIVAQLLRRMINLEKLILFLSVIRQDSTVIDGIQLYDQVLIHMPQLKKFVFSINTSVLFRENKINLPSNEDIQESFIGREYGEVGSYVHFEPRKPTGRVSRPDYKPPTSVVKCHIYSIPYDFENFLHLNNSFPSGMFIKVRCLTMTDTYPFEHQFFKIISDDFPFLRELKIQNTVSQKEKQHSSVLVNFPHLNLLNLVNAHVDYAEQFLVDTNTCLPCLSDLCIRYEPLTMLTNNFTNDRTRLYCAQLKGLHIEESFVRSKHFDQYFPSLL